MARADQRATWATGSSQTTALKQLSRPRQAAWLEGAEYLAKDDSAVNKNLNKHAFKGTEKPESNEQTEKQSVRMKTEF